VPDVGSLDSRVVIDRISKIDEFLKNAMRYQYSNMNKPL
jgi:hypothetical protein